MTKLRKNNRLFNYNYEYCSLYFLYKYHYHFFQSLIYCGRKLWAFNFFINIKDGLKQSECIDPLVVFFIGIINISPEVLLFPLKLGGLVSEVPMPITIRKQIIFATKWVIKLLKDNFRIIKLDYVINILIDSIRNKGLSISKKKVVYAEAIRNRYLIKYLK